MSWWVVCCWRFFFHCASFCTVRFSRGMDGKFPVISMGGTHSPAASPRNNGGVVFSVHKAHSSSRLLPKVNVQVDKVELLGAEHKCNTWRTAQPLESAAGEGQGCPPGSGTQSCPQNEKGASARAWILNTHWLEEPREGESVRMRFSILKVT